MTRVVIILCVLATLVTADNSEQKHLPPVYLNHANLILSQKLYEAIKESEFLKEFSSGGEHTVSGVYGNQSYTHISLYGEHTYLELKNSAAMKPNELRRKIILFIMSVDDRQQLPAVAASFEHHRMHVQTETATRSVAGHDVKWHDTVNAAKWENDPDPDHSAWFDVAAIYPGYLKAMYPDLTPQEDGTTRQQYNARKYRADLLMHDITGLDVDVMRDQLPLLESQFKALGYSVDKTKTEMSANGPEITFRFRAVEGTTPRVLTIHFSLNKVKNGQEVYRFPQSELTFHSDRTATWTFPASLD